MYAFVLMMVFVGAYLMGSVSSAILVCKAMGLGDPREAGSNNPGATNVLRLGGKKPAALTLLGDVLKGLFPVVVAQAFFDTPWVTSGALICAVVGHMYPLWFKFEGGKGVATLIGGLMGLSLWVALLWGLIFAGVLYKRKMVSLASICATLALPILAAVLVSWWHFLPLSFVSGLVVWRHRENIERIKRGEEKTIRLPF